AGHPARPAVGKAGAPNPVLRAMNMLGYSAGALGNHEYNYGLPALDRALRQARFPFVAANVFLAGSRKPAYRQYALIPHVVAPGDTILMGVTGITPPGVALWDRNNVAGKLEFRDPVASLRPVVAELKARGADVVVVLNHGGFEGTSYDTAATGLPAENAGLRIAREVPGVDVIFLGHTHREVSDSVVNGVLFAQAGAWARSLAEAQVTLRRRGSSDWVVAGKTASLLRGTPGRASQALLDSLRAAHEEAVSYVASVIGRAAAPLDAARARTEDTPLVDFMNEVQRRVAGAQLSATAAFSTSARVARGPVTIGQIAALYPYENTLAAVRITGAQLKAYLEKSAEYFRSWPLAPGQSLLNPDVPGYNFDIVSGVEYTIDLSQPVGQRISSLTYQGRKVAPAQSFTMALNNYRQGGGGGFAMLAHAPVTYTSDRDIRGLLIDEVRRRGILRPADYFRPSWRIVPAAAQQEAERELSGEAGPRRGVATSPEAVRKAQPGAVSRTPPLPHAPTVSQSKRLRVLTLNDLHGHLLPETYGWSQGRPVGGAATLAAYFRAERDSFPGPAIVLDGGDEMQGTPVSNLSQGSATVALENALGTRGAAIGNHEFDWGVPVLRQRLAQAGYPWLAANIFVAGSDTAPSWVRDTATLVVGGVHVGLIGLATQATPSTTKQENVAGLEFRDGAAAIDRWVPVLRRGGADFVVVIAHSGAMCDSTGASGCRGEVVDWAGRVRERPDLIVAGHTHTLMR
ncbi:MAG TPA: 5'-nucleotidase C-terminal domain-containing protein, partial [Longimicrobiales bacterium]